MTQRLIFVVLANDAKSESGEYCELGDNSVVRIKHAVLYRKTLLTDCQVTWIFGAGADEQHSNGPTLASLGERTLRTLLPGEIVFANKLDREAYGSLEEIEWAWAKAKSEYPHEPLELLLFSQRRHLQRVECIMSWFFPQVTYRLMTTGQTKEIPHLHEIRGYVKLFLIKCGLGRMVQKVQRRVSLSFNRG